MGKLFGWLTGFRKFIIMMLFLVTMIVFRAVNYIDGAQFSEHLQLAVVAFFGTNIGEHILKTAETWITEKFKAGK